MLKKTILLTALLIILAPLSFAQQMYYRAPKAAPTEDRYDGDAVHQISTLSALIGGVYDGTMTYSELEMLGDFGLGTFNAIDGEMVALDGVFYKIDHSGHARVAPKALLVPFAAVKRFIPESTVGIRPGLDYAGLKAGLDEALPTKNIVYAIRIDGRFGYIKARSVPEQKRPYPPLSRVIEEQSVFEFRDVDGTLVGFRMPALFGHTVVPGYHFHFITRDRGLGGHLLELRTGEATALIDPSRGLNIVLPASGDFDGKDLDKSGAYTPGVESAKTKGGPVD